MAMLRLADIEALVWYEDLAGDEPAVVYLHGLTGASSGYMVGVARHPALARRRAILVDLPGHGYSDAPGGYAYRLADHAAAVAAVLDHRGAAGCAVVGHSFGGAVAVVLATERPDLVSRVVSAEGNLGPATAGASKLIAAYSEEEFCASGAEAMLGPFRAAGLAGDPMAQLGSAVARVADRRALHRTSVALMRELDPPLWERFATLPIPRAYLYGALTLREAAHVERAERLRARGIPVPVVPDAGHVMLDNLDGFAAAIAAALVLD